MNLLVVTDSLFPFTGITKVLFEILPRLKGVDVTILFPSEKVTLEPKFKGIRLVRTNKLFYFKGHPIAGISNKIKTLVKDSDIIWANIGGPLGMQSLSEAKKTGKPVVTYHHLFEDEIFKENVNFILKPLSPILRKAINLFYNKCDLVMVPSKNIGLEILRRGIKTKQKVVRLGVDLPKKIGKEKARRKLGFKKDRIIIGFLGRISEEKDLATLVEAWKLLKKERDVELIIVGHGEKHLEKELKEEGAKVTGFVKNPETYLQAIDVFVLPSLTETTSLATLEAMAAGLPVVVTKVGYVKNYIKDGVNGLFFKKGDSEDLTRKVRMVLRNKRLSERLSKNARMTAKEFSWKKTASEITKVLTTIYRESQGRK